MMKGAFHKSRRSVLKIEKERNHIVNNVKYLEVINDEQMKFSIHVLDIVERTRKLLMSLSKILAQENGEYGCRALRILYKRTIQSLLLYGYELEKWLLYVEKWLELKS